MLSYYYSPESGVTNHISPATFSILLSLRSTPQQIGVCQPSPVSQCPPCQLWEVSHHTSPPLISTTQLDELYMIIIHPEPVLPTIPPLQPSPPYYLKIYPQSLLAGNVWTCQYNLLYLRPGATLHVLLTSCMKCPSTPPPHYNNTSRSIFGQKPVSLHVLLTSCWKCPSTPPPHGNNTYPQLIFSQNPVSLSKCS